MTTIRIRMLALASGVIATAAWAQEGPTLTVEDHEPFGNYIVGPDGAPVYMFTTDEQGNGDSARISCGDDCLDLWPLITVDAGVEPTVGDALDESLVGTMEHDGRTVVTYNGWPLYRYVADQGGPPPEGQDVESFGGEWYLLTPDGTKVEEEG